MMQGRTTAHFAATVLFSVDERWALAGSYFFIALKSTDVCIQRVAVVLGSVSSSVTDRSVAVLLLSLTAKVGSFCVGNIQWLSILAPRSASTLSTCVNERLVVAVGLHIQPAAAISCVR